jgi:hypothetical protein
LEVVSSVNDAYWVDFDYWLLALEHLSDNLLALDGNH